MFRGDLMHPGARVPTLHPDRTTRRILRRFVGLQDRMDQGPDFGGRQLFLDIHLGSHVEHVPEEPFQRAFDPVVERRHRKGAGSLAIFRQPRGALSNHAVVATRGALAAGQDGTSALRCMANPTESRRGLQEFFATPLRDAVHVRRQTTRLRLRGAGKFGETSGHFLRRTSAPYFEPSALGESGAGLIQSFTKFFVGPCRKADASVVVQLGVGKHHTRRRVHRMRQQMFDFAESRAAIGHPDAPCVLLRPRRTRRRRGGTTSFEKPGDDHDIGSQPSQVAKSDQLDAAFDTRTNGHRHRAEHGEERADVIVP